MRQKEPTPENLRQGLPLNQDKYKDKKKQLEAERQKEYNEMIQQVLKQAWKGTNTNRCSDVVLSLEFLSLLLKKKCF